MQTDGCSRQCANIHKPECSARHWKGLKGKITTKKQYIGNTKKDIGAYCYELFEAGDIKDPRIEELCEQIKAYSEEIEALEAEIEEVKEKYRVKNDEDDPAAEK